MIVNETDAGESMGALSIYTVWRYAGLIYLDHALILFPAGALILEGWVETAARRVTKRLTYPAGPAQPLDIDGVQTQGFIRVTSLDGVQ